MRDPDRPDSVSPDAETSAAFMRHTRPEREPELGPGVVVGAFEIVRELGAGGMATVYLALDTQLGRKVALKFPGRNARPTQESIERFMAEARVTASFSHPNIVGLYTVAVFRGHPYVALEYVEGQTLRERMQTDPPTGRAALRLARAMIEGIREAHAHGVLHRDLKPENVLIGKDGRLRVADFGLAIYDSSSAEGQIEGTVRYMAPEQWMGRPEQASDIWAFALILHELLTGEVPYGELPQDERLEVLFNSDPPAINRGPLDQAVAELITQCLAKKSADRPTADAVFQRVDQLVGDQVALSPSESEGPYRGLFSFDERHASMFFGREGEISAAVERLREDPLLPIVAPSGTGKSSFVRAGLLPRLREQERWSLVACRPGADPFDSLATAIQSSLADGSLSTGVLHGSKEDARGSVIEANLKSLLQFDSTTLLTALREIAKTNRSKVLLSIDALEELYTHEVDPRLCTAFLEAVGRVAEAARAEIRVVLAFRDDFLGRVAQSSTRPLFERIFVLRQLDESALEAVIVRPLHGFGYRFEDPALPAMMVAEIKGELAALPLLQFAANQLWIERDRERKLLTRAAFDEQGGVSGALVKHADGILAEFLPDQIALTRALLLRLVTSDRTRKVVLMSVLIDGLSDKSPSVIERLARARLLTLRRGVGDDNAVELVHEALIRRWSQLQRWMDEGRDELSVLAEVQPAAERWHRQGRPAADAWTGPALHDARRVLLRQGADLTDLVRDFLDAGSAREKLEKRRRRALVAGVIGTLMLGATGATVSALLISREKGRAEIARGHAERLSADVLLEAAEAALQNHEGGKAAALVRASLAQFDSLRARALLAQSQQEQTRWVVSRSAAPNLFAIARTPYIASGVESGRIQLIDTRTGRAEWMFGHPDEVFAFAMSDPSTLWTAGRSAIYRWNFSAKIATEWMRFSPGTMLEDGQFSADGRTLLVLEASAIAEIDVHAKTISHHAVPAPTAGEMAMDRESSCVGVALTDRTYRVYRRSPWSEVAVVHLSEQSYGRAIFSPDGTRVLVGDGNALIEHELSTGRERRVAEDNAPVDRLITAHQGDRFMLTRRQRQLAEVWRFGARAPEQVLPLEGGEFLRTMTDAGDTFGTANLGTAKVKLLRIEPPEPLVAHWGGEGVIGTQFARDDLTIVAGAGPNFVRLPVNEPSGAMLVERGEAPIASVALSADDQWEAFGQTTGVLTVRHRHRVERHRIVSGQTWPFGLEFSPSNQILAASGASAEIGLWSVGAFATLPALNVQLSVSNEVHWSTDEQRLLTGVSSNHSFQIWDLTTRSLLREVALPARGTGVSWSPDNTRVAAGAHDSLVLYDLTRSTSRSVQLKELAFWTDFSHDSRRVAVGCDAGVVAVVAWDSAAGGAIAEPRYFWGHRAAKEVNHVHFSHDDRLLLSASDDGTVRLWDVDTTMPIWRAPAVLAQPLRWFSNRGWRDFNDQGARSLISAGATRRIEQSTRDLVQSPSGTACLTHNNHQVEHWDLAENSARFVMSNPEDRRPVALDHGCVVLQQSRVHVRLTSQLEERTWGDGVRAIARATLTLTTPGEALLVATDAEIQWRSLEGAVMRSIPSPTRAAQIWDDTQALVVTSITGEIYVRPVGSAQFLRMDTRALHTHVSSVILRGPANTLFVGFDDGIVAHFDIATGRALWTRRLYGSIQHLVMSGTNLHVLTDLGVHHREPMDWLTLDLSAIRQRAAQESPGVWSQGEVRLP